MNGLRLQIFVGSPDELSEERRQVIHAVHSLSVQLSDAQIPMAAFDFNDLLGGVGDPQHVLDARIRSCDLVLLLIGRRRAVGTIHEFEVARHAWAERAVGSVLLFVERHGEQEDVDESIRAFEGYARKLVFCHHYHRGQLVAEVTKRVTQWMAPLMEVVRLGKSFPVIDSVLATMRVPEPAFPFEVVRLARLNWEDQRSIAENALERYVSLGTSRTIAQTDAWLIARLLFELLGAEKPDPALFEQREFVNTVHQYLAHMIREERRLSAGTTVRRIHVLRGWLSDRGRVAPTARNFSAFELGMCRDYESAPALCDRVRDEQEDDSVRVYAAYALGMLRLRTALRETIKLYDAERDPQIKIVLGHAAIATADVHQ